MVLSGRRDLQRQACERLTANVGEVGGRRWLDHVRGRLLLRPRTLTLQHRDEDVEPAHRPDHAGGDDARFEHVRLRHDDVRVADCRCHRRHAGDRADGAVQPDLTDEREPLHRSRRDGVGGNEDTDREREIEPCAALANAARRKVHRDPLVRPDETARQQRRPDAISRLPADLVRQADDAEPRQTGSDVHLDGHPVSARSEQAGGGDGSEHRSSYDTGRNTHRDS